ncbi:sugar ABC transporter ATP-binding protein [Cohaesibacter gelatinilyticus]|uniref:Autoinducer 2 import ATP-binding protein LsrA n=1 Tax=Cohaesibacter gelatinilyticus TaxID=372072 RepID=A0A285PFD2_9HYPH|nr:sugar ABC transporter ATP-binding protein [Cohaesibacter gelatinilyticus]SNZ20419.1 monosaccharide ABC transporter ATP-binding protein, CUT2 family [Cohaesibacter gelatinilyticus]
MENTAVALNNIEKTFGANRVLRGVNLDIPKGKVTVLMGANGAGKSTLVKILCGVYARDGGDIRLDGQEFHPETPSQAIQQGVVTVHQNINDGVIPDLDVASNLMLDKLAGGDRSFFFNPTKNRREAQKIAERMGLEIDVSTEVQNLALADRQLVAIARAMAHEPKLMILDEPTSSLSASEAKRLFSLVDMLRDRGVAILYISHRMSDIRRLANRIVSMRDGAISGVFEEDNLDYEGAVNAMLGHRMTDVDIDVQASGSIALSLDNVILKPGASPISLQAHRNEVIAITGLVGTGKSRLAETLFGVCPVEGSITVNGETYAPKTTGQAIEKGVFLCPKDRGSSAVIPEADITRNITLPFLKHMATLSFVNKRAERRAAQELISKLGVVCQSENDDIGTLSGGNQQKVMVARWLSQPCDVLVLDEPFQGVDIAARRDIGRKLRETADQRATIVMVAELDEALEIADRILVMAEHTIVGDHINDANINIDQVLMEVAGQAASPSGHQEKVAS